ncbi:MAG: 2,3-bisphosphoglycerate-independent phosphoglycerate mutase [Thermoleophilia bacterium]
MAAGPLVLIVIDGFGIAPPGPGNAVSLARTPTLDALAAESSATRIEASGLPVGLPDGQMGNSEVGHLNLGAGRRVPQMLVRIDEAIADGSIGRIPAAEEALAAGREAGVLHLVGLAGGGGVHAQQRHALALVRLARDAGVPRVVVHAITDGRDTRPDAALEAVRELEASGATVATVVGRYWAMDRDRRWERTARAYDAMVHGHGEGRASGEEAVRLSYDGGVTDEFIEPAVIGPPSENRIRPGDPVIYWNFRPDRARQLTMAFTEPEFDGFDRHGGGLARLTTMTRYKAEFTAPVLFEAQDVRQGLAETVSAAGRRQLHVAETEKYAHVTFFFNGGREEPFEGERRVLVPSPQHVPTYDKAPEMSATGVRDAVVQGLAEGTDELLVVNFANADMVGHTGVVEAAVRGIETVDACMARIRPAVAAAGGLLAVTADHGNSEVMIEPDGSPNTAHTSNPVPLWIDRPGLALREGGSLGDIAPTLCGLMGWDPSPSMTGVPLI